MLAKKTHREVKSPQITARYLADFMSASETAKRTIIRNCKYQPTAPLVQHKHAKVAVSHFIASSGSDAAPLAGRAAQLRNMMADDEFTRLTLDSNADYLDRFANVCSQIAMPKAERFPPGKEVPVVLNGVKITIEILFRLRRTTSTNEVKTGGGMVRYLKNWLLNPETAAWQSSFLLGYLDVESQQVVLG